MGILAPTICFMLGIAAHYAWNRYKLYHFDNAIHERRYYSTDCTCTDAYNEISEYFQAHQKELNLIKMTFHSGLSLHNNTAYIDIWYTINDPEFKVSF